MVALLLGQLNVSAQSAELKALKSGSGIVAVGGVEFDTQSGIGPLFEKYELCVWL